MIDREESPSDLSYHSDTYDCQLPSFGFGKHLRLLNGHHYSAVFSDAPLRASHPSFLILARRNQLCHPRLGLIVAKKHVKRAVGRNRIKRTCRESFRLQQHKLPAIDVIVLARRGADSIPPHELQTIINGLWKRIIKRATAQTTAS